MLYKIDHYYNLGRSNCKYAIVVESDIESEMLAKIVGAIQLRFEELQDKEDCIDDIHLLRLLESYYGVKDVKEQYRHVLKQTVLQDEQWEKIVHIPIVDGVNEYEIIQIDQYASRESLCGGNYRDSFDCLPAAEQFILELGDLSKYYLYRNRNKLQIAKELLKNTTNIYLKKQIDNYIANMNGYIKAYIDEKDFVIKDELISLDLCIAYIEREKFDITDWELCEIPIYYAHIFYNPKTEKMFNLAVFEDGEVIPRYIKNGNEEDAASIQEAIEKYSTDI